MSIETLESFADQRGVLVELVRRPELGAAPAFGSIYVATLCQGAVRGNHYHRAREEYLLVLAGEALLVLEDARTGERREQRLAGLGAGAQARVRIGPGVAHAIRNVGPEPVIMCAYCTVPYDPDTPDDVPHPLL